uniref:Cadherin domain-containing protein n=1 Tax=Timema cristinae TaxID=61476 RepID=A0A7R9GRD1_TIMCR|nr:unnamed protein product [Timema cristinae]
MMGRSGFKPQSGCSAKEGPSNESTHCFYLCYYDNIGRSCQVASMGLYPGFTLNENISPSNWDRSGHLSRIQGTNISGLAVCLSICIRTRKCTHICVEEEWKTIWGKTTLNTSDRDSNLDLPVIGSLVYCESRSLDHAVAEAGSEMAAITNCLLLATLGSLLAVNANVPLFDVSTSIRVLIVPYDARVGSAIYRLRGTDADFDFPLRFEVVGSAGGHIIHTVDIPCDKNHTFCEGDVVLSRPLERGRVYDVRLKVVDTTGDFTILDCTIRTSSRTTPTDTIFPHLPSLIEVAEDAVPGTELDYVIARNNPLNARHVSLELRGSPEFMLRRSLASKDTVKGTIILAAPLDFEKRAMYILHMFAVDPYAEPHNDTRNVASFQVAVAVRDAQDMPPVFQNVPPVTMIKHTVQPGDVVLQVHAKDGDKGQPRQVRYGLVSEENPFTTFFHINDRTGEITLSRPLRELLTITRFTSTCLTDGTGRGSQNGPA